LDFYGKKEKKTFVIKISPLLLVSERAESFSIPKASGATMAGLKKRRNITPPTAVVAASGNLFSTS